jgi:hypothetical protein
MTPLLAAERMDIWVLKFSIAISLTFFVVLLLWHVVGNWAGKVSRKRRKARLSPEPPPRDFATDLARARAVLIASRAGDADIQAKRGRQAKQLLALAREDFDNERLLSCLERCRSLAETFADLPEGAEATQLAAEVKSDPERLQRACVALEDLLAEIHLTLAESWLRGGRPQQASAALQRIVQNYPETRHAQVARDRLRQLVDPSVGD